MEQWNRGAVGALLAEAGRLALATYEQPARETKADGTLVTEADHAIEALMTARLEAPADGCYLIGEETVEQRSPAYLQAALAATVYIVDPIDGTACYAHRLPLWGISLGMAQGGELREGAIYLPVLRELFISDGDDVLMALVPPGEEANPERWSWQALVPVAEAYRPTGLVAITQGIAKRGTIWLPNPVHAIACAVIPLAYLLVGRYEAYFAQLKLWDLAGGLPLLLKAGYAPRLLDGTPLGASLSPAVWHLEPGHAECWKLRTPCLFARPGVAEHVLPGIEP